MLRFFRITDGLIKEMGSSTASPATLLKQADWIDACEPDEAERRILQDLLKTDIPEFDDVEEIEASARCFVDQAGVHVHSLFLNLADGRHNTVSVAFILQNRRLITIRESELADFRLLRMRARRGQVEARSVAEMLVTLLEQKVENHADGLEDLHRQLEDVSYLVLEDEEAELDEAINRDIETLMSHTTFLFDKINFLMDSTQGFINIEQNQIIKTFSIAAVVFLPPTLIASIYGMNFEHMPELEWLLGYPGAIVLMVSAGFAPYWYFKRKGWL